MRGNKTPRLKFSRKIAIAIMLEIFAKNRDRELSRAEMRIIRITSIVRICI